MIRCFILQAKQGISLKGFNSNKFYLAKVTNNSQNTLAVLDEKLNWVPFEYKPMCMRVRPIYTDYFTKKTIMLTPNKKSLNMFVEDCVASSYELCINTLFEFTIPEEERLSAVLK